MVKLNENTMSRLQKSDKPKIILTTPSGKQFGYNTQEEFIAQRMKDIKSTELE